MKKRARIGILIVLLVLLFLASSAYAQIDLQSSKAEADRTTAGTGYSIKFTVSVYDINGNPAGGIFIRPEASLGAFSPESGVTGNLGTAEFIMSSNIAGTTTVVFYYSYGGAEFVLDTVAVTFADASIQTNQQSCQAKYGISNSDPCCLGGTTLLQSRCCSNTGFFGDGHILSEACSGSTKLQEICNLNSDGSISINSVAVQNACETPSIIPQTVQNSCPSTTSAEINPVIDNDVYTNTVLKANAHGFFDLDNDPAQFEYKWYNNNVLVFEEINGAFSEYAYYSRIGDVITVDVRPYDGICFGTKVSDRVAIQNSNPELSISSDSTEANPKRSGETVTFTINSFDREGNIFNYIVEFGDGEKGAVSASVPLQSSSLLQCDDGIDNDGNGLKDYPYDPGCTSLQDASETGTSQMPQCSDHTDNDGDFFFDWPFDKGCESASDSSENDPPVAPRCSNYIDDDGDQKQDFPHDMGCISASDNDEQDPLFFTPDCSNGLDDDSDGFIDLRFDRECFAAADNEEDAARSECHDFIDNDADGLIDLYDSDCINPYDSNERTLVAGTCPQITPPLPIPGCTFTPIINSTNGCTIGYRRACITPNPYNTTTNTTINNCVPQSLLGDANGNDRIDVIDLILIFQYSAGLINYAGDTCCLDANNDRVDGNILDAQYVANIAAGLSQQLGICSNRTTGIIPQNPPQRVRDCFNTNICGDTDHDNDVDVLDSLFLARYTVGSESWSQNSWCLDANGNGVVDVNDALYSSQVAAGLRQITTSCTGGTGGGNTTRFTPITSVSINPYYSPATRTFTITHSYITSTNTTYFANVSAYTSAIIVANASTLVPITGVTTREINCPEVQELNAELFGQTNRQVLLSWQLPADGHLIKQLKVCRLDDTDENTSFSSESPQFEASCNLNGAPILSSTATTYVDNAQGVDKRYYKVQSVCSLPAGETGCSENSLIGDADLDGSIEDNDALVLARIAVGLDSFNGNICCLDVNNNGRVDVVDSELSKQISEGVIQPLGTCANRIRPSYPVRNCNSGSLLGDTNNDGSLGVLDSLFLARYSVGLEQWGSDTCCLDANNDGIDGNVLDSLYAARAGVGLVPPLGTCTESIPAEVSECDSGDKLGDVSSDGRVDINDALLLSPYTTGSSLWGGNDCCLDANNDGIRGNVLDVFYIAQIASGREQQLGTCANPIPRRPNPTNTTDSELLDCFDNSLRGDTNHDDRVNVLDALFLSQYSVGLKQWGSGDCCLDADGNGVAGDVLDSLYVSQIDAGLKPQLGRCNEPVPNLGGLSGTGLAFADISGMPTVGLPQEFCGDINGNGNYDNDDVRMISEHVSGSSLLNNPNCADINNDGSVNVLDALRLSQLIGTKILLTCNGCPSFNPSPSGNVSSSTLTTITVGQVAIPIYATNQVYNEIALPLLPKDASVEEAFKSIGTGRGKNNNPSVVTVYPFCNKNDFMGSYDEVRDFSYADFKNAKISGSSSREAEIIASKLYDPSVDCRLYSYGDVDLFNAEPGHNYMLKVTNDDVLRNVGRVVYPRKTLNMFESKSNNKNNWFGSIFVYEKDVDDALLSDDEASTPFASRYDRIQHFDVLEFKRLISGGASITQAIADSNYDYSPGGVPGLFRLTKIKPSEGYRISMTDDDDLLMAYD